jgi:hypothetical protein
MQIFYLLYRRILYAAPQICVDVRITCLPISIGDTAECPTPRFARSTRATKIIKRSVVLDGRPQVCGCLGGLKEFFLAELVGRKRVGIFFFHTER